MGPCSQRRKPCLPSSARPVVRSIRQAKLHRLIARCARTSVNSFRPRAEAAGGKLISMYSTPADGPGVMVIFDVPDPRCSTGDLWRCRSIRCPPQRKAHPSLDAGRSDARSAKGKSASWRIQDAQQVNALVAADSAATNLRYSRQLPPYAAPLPRRVNRYQPTPPQRRPLSVLSPIADKRGRGWLVRFVPIADMEDREKVGLPEQVSGDQTRQSMIGLFGNDSLNWRGCRPRPVPLTLRTRFAGATADRAKGETHAQVALHRRKREDDSYQ